MNQEATFVFTFVYFSRGLAIVKLRHFFRLKFLRPVLQKIYTPVRNDTKKKLFEVAVCILNFFYFIFAQSNFCQKEKDKKKKKNTSEEFENIASYKEDL